MIQQTSSASARPSLDIAELRRQTPGCTHRTHLNNAGSSLPTSSVLAAMVDHLTREAMEGGYEAQAHAATQIAEGRAAIARLIGAQSHEIAYATSDTQAFAKAFWGLVQSGWFAAGDVIAVDALSYNSHHLALLQAARTHSLRIEMVDVFTELSARTRLVAYTHIGTHSGAIHDFTGVSAITRALGIPFFLDACQSVGQVALNVHTLGCDVLTATGRKWLRGPRGSGFLYVAEDWITRLEPLAIDGHSTKWQGPNRFTLNADATRFEEFECSIAAKVGLSVAVREALALGMGVIQARIQSLAAYTRRRLSEIDGITLCDGANARSGIVTFRHAQMSAAHIVTEASQRGLNISQSTPAWIAQGALPDAVVRLSPHIYNTEEEIDRLAEIIAAIGAHHE